MKIVEHKLTDVPFEPTPNRGGVIVPSLLVIHYTVTRTMAATVRAFKSPDVRASAHLVLEADGSVTQMVPFNVKAWHAGRSEWAGRAGCNDFSIGIEVVNPGPLQRRGSEHCDVNGVTWSGAVVKARHKNGSRQYGAWAAYSSEQLAKLREIGALLVAEYGLHEVVGHDDIAPLRKIDPGPAFPMENFRAELFGRADDGAELYETTSTLNVRKGPAVSFDPVPGSPFVKGARLRVAEQQGLWWHVLGEGSSVEGWVHSRFLTPARPRQSGGSA